MTNLVPTSANLPADGVRPEIKSVCCLSDATAPLFDTRRALASLKARGLLVLLPQAAANARAAQAPVNPERLTDRLTALGMMMAPNRPPAEAAVWLNEMTRLLGDLPEDVLASAIDGLVKTCKFLPTCAEIREKAEPLAAQRRRLVAQLEAMVRYVDSGQHIPTFAPPQPATNRKREPDGPMTPEQIEEWNEIMAKAGARTRYRPDGSRYEVARDGQTPRHRGPPRRPTREDYIALGVDPAILDQKNAA